MKENELYFTKEELNALEKALNVFLSGDKYQQLNKEEKDVVVDAVVSMLNALKREKKKMSKFPHFLVKKIKNLFHQCLVTDIILNENTL